MLVGLYLRRIASTQTDHIPLFLLLNAVWGILWKRHTPSSPIDGEVGRDLQSQSEPKPVMMETNMAA